MPAMRTWVRTSIAAGWLGLFPVVLAADTTDIPKFETDIAPIFEARCVKCHGDGKLEAGLDLRRRFLIVKGGDSGAALLEGKPDESLLIQKIDADEMPPKDEGRLDDKQKALLR